jgi:hypothetical protein
LITNFGSFVNIACYVVKAFISVIVMDEEHSAEDNMIRVNEDTPWLIIFIFSYSTIVPVVLSTLNPVIYIVFTPGTWTIRNTSNKALDSSRLREVTNTATQ